MSCETNMGLNFYKTEDVMSMPVERQTVCKICGSNDNEMVPTPDHVVCLCTSMLPPLCLERIHLCIHLLSMPNLSLNIPHFCFASCALILNILALIVNVGIRNDRRSRFGNGAWHKDFQSWGPLDHCRPPRRGTERDAMKYFQYIASDNDFLFFRLLLLIRYLSFAACRTM